MFRRRFAADWRKQLWAMAIEYCRSRPFAEEVTLSLGQRFKLLECHSVSEFRNNNSRCCTKERPAISEG
jgi:hypothetical protein